jgi:hypothetical protein
LIHFKPGRLDSSALHQFFFMGSHVPRGREALAMHLWPVRFRSGPPIFKCGSSEAVFRWAEVTVGKTVKHPMPVPPDELRLLGIAAVRKKVRFLHDSLNQHGVAATATLGSTPNISTFS